MVSEELSLQADNALFFRISGSNNMNITIPFQFFHCFSTLFTKIRAMYQFHSVTGQEKNTDQAFSASAPSAFCADHF